MAKKPTTVEEYAEEIQKEIQRGERVQTQLKQVVTELAQKKQQLEASQKNASEARMVEFDEKRLAQTILNAKNSCQNLALTLLTLIAVVLVIYVFL